MEASNVIKISILLLASLAATGPAIATSAPGIVASAPSPEDAVCVPMGLPWILQDFQCNVEIAPAFQEK